MKSCGKQKTNGGNVTDTTYVHMPAQDSLIEHADSDSLNTDSAAIPQDTSVIRQAQGIGESGKLKITLMWDFLADIDLHVIEPSGEEVYYDHKTSNSTGGELDVDDRNGGIKHDGRPAAENIYWENPQHGIYKVSINYFINSRHNGSGICTIVVHQEGKQDRDYKVTMNNNERGKTKHVVDVIVP